MKPTLPKRRQTPRADRERERIEFLEAELRDTKYALKFLHDETADYIRVNKLGKVHHNSAMRQAEMVLGIPTEL